LSTCFDQPNLIVQNILDHATHGLRLLHGHSQQTCHEFAERTSEIEKGYQKMKSLGFSNTRACQETDEYTN